MRVLLIVMLIAFSVNTLAKDTKDWTFLVFLNGHNNLDTFGAFNINEMEKVGSTSKVNVVVQWASLQNKKTLRLYVQKDNDTDKVTSPIMQALPRVDMGDPKSLVDFVKWGVKNYPAKHYFIAVWNHGSGWHMEDVNNAGKMDFAMHMENISWDDVSGHSISTVQLAKAMDDSAKIIGHKVDIYGSDACLMAMPEIALQMRDSVEYYVGSEETEPGQGWPYTEILTQWNNLSYASPEDVSQIMYKEYVTSYLADGSHNQADVTFSAFSLSSTRGQPFLESVRALAMTLYTLDKGDKAKVVDAISQTQVFLYSDYGDLMDFMKNLETKGIVSQNLTNAIANVRKNVPSFLLGSASTSMYSKAQGISVWLPSNKATMDQYYAQYQDLVFNELTGWGDALMSLF